MVGVLDVCRDNLAMPPRRGISPHSLNYWADRHLRAPFLTSSPSAGRHCDQGWTMTLPGCLGWGHDDHWNYDELKDAPSPREVSRAWREAKFQSYHLEMRDGVPLAVDVICPPDRRVPFGAGAYAGAAAA